MHLPHSELPGDQFALFIPREVHRSDACGSLDLFNLDDPLARLAVDFEFDLFILLSAEESGQQGAGQK